MKPSFKKIFQTVFLCCFLIRPAGAAELFTEILSVQKDVYVGEEFEIKIRLWDGMGLLDVRFLPAGWKNIEIFPDKNLTELTLKQNDVPYHVTEVRLRAVIKTVGKQKFPSLCLAATVPEKILSGNINFGKELSAPSPDAFKNVVFSEKTKELKTCAEPFSVNVLPLPKNTPALFPATKVELLSGVLPDTPSVTAGTPVKRSVVLLADGTLPAYLPDFVSPEMKNVKIYAGRLDHSLSAEGRHLTAALRRTFVYIPEKPGTLILPAVQVKWFNTQTQQVETASLPVYTIEVVPSPIMEEIQTLSTNPSQKIGTIQSLLALPEKIFSFIRLKLSKVNIFYILLFISGIVFFAFSAKKYMYPLALQRIKNKKTIIRLYQACLADNAEEIEKNLIRWGQNMVPERQIMTLSDVSSLFRRDDHQIQSCLDRLNYNLYGMGRFTKFLPALKKRTDTETLGIEIWTAFEKVEIVSLKKSKKRKDDLPELYPEKQ